jgi:hypothetical protein
LRHKTARQPAPVRIIDVERGLHADELGPCGAENVQRVAQLPGSGLSSASYTTTKSPRASIAQPSVPKWLQRLRSILRTLRPAFRPRYRGAWVSEAYADVPLDSTYVVCGYYTPDYHRWLPELIDSLIDWQAPYCFVRLPKARGGWEANTMSKPQHILAAMDRHPDQVIIWLDVDCVVFGSLASLVDIRADVAFRMHGKFRSRKGATFRAQSGTMVFRPTPEARQFVENWRTASENAPYGEIDQSSQVVAMAMSIGTTFAPLPLIYCVNPDEWFDDGVIRHSSARAMLRLPRTGSALRYLGRILGWRTMR